MTSRSPHRTVSGLALVVVLLAATTPAVLAAESGTASFLNKPAPAFELPDAKGETRALADFRGEKGTVVLWVSTKCPVSNAYNSRMTALSDKYSGKGFQFVGVNSNRSEGREEIASHALDNGLGFPILKDKKNVVADTYGASVTPEVYVLDAEGVLRYHGRIDDSMNESAVSSKDLESVLDAMIAGETLPKTESKAFGCTIKRAG